MGTTVLGHPATISQQTGRGDPVHGVGGLCDQGGRLSPRGSSGTVGSATNWARPQVEHSHICNG